MFGLNETAGQPTEEQARQVFRMFTHHEADIRQYDQDFGIEIANANTDYQLTNTPDVVQTREEAFQPSFDLLAAAYSFGASIDEIFIDFIPDAADHPNDPPTNSIDRTDEPQANDLIFGESGNDKILASAGNDVVYGDFGDSTLDANNNAGDDSLAGGTGDDTLVGGLGKDTFEGGAGPDRFIIGGDDTILDPEQGDRIGFLDGGSSNPIWLHGGGPTGGESNGEEGRQELAGRKVPTRRKPAPAPSRTTYRRTATSSSTCRMAAQ